MREAITLSPNENNSFSSDPRFMCLKAASYSKVISTIAVLLFALNTLNYIVIIDAYLSKHGIV